MRAAAVFVAVCAALLFPAAAFCEAVVAVTPTRIPLRMAPGEARSGTVELINQGDERTVLRPRVAMVGADEAGGTAFYRDEKCAWLSPGKPEMVLAPAAREDCPFTVQVPGDAPPGAYRFALAFELAREESGGVGFTGGVAVLVELEVVDEGGGGTGAGGGSLALKIALPALAASLLAAAAAVGAVARSRRKKALGAGAEGGDAP